MDRFVRKTKGDRPVVAICYDFDKTLSPDNMQAQGYLQAINYENQNEFWAETNRLAVDHDMDTTLAWMYLMLRGARGKEIFRREMLERYGSRVKLYSGVREWFDRIAVYADSRGVEVEHYIISSGLKEMIDGTEVADKFEKIYASSFCYDDDGVAIWPAQVVNFTNKTQFLFRISKGVLDINDEAVNDYFSPDEIRIPFRNIVYIGDSETDIPCMKLVNSYGGYSVGVYDPEKENKDRVYRMIQENRIKYYAPADYTEGAELDEIIKLVIDRTAVNDRLENKYYRDLNEAGKKERNEE
ncbi:MAG: haloacid dehalogenase-like hydrolase [Clostridiales bacterium]|nr:haloacid dehalogenase-like hydrolase [Clostridiales bacterium]